MFDLKTMEARIAAFDPEKEAQARVTAMREAARNLPDPLRQNLLKKADETQQAADFFYGED